MQEQNNKNNKNTDFGYQQIPIQDKAKAVKGIFDFVASKYDLMNDVMSFGMHRYWKHVAINKCTILPCYKVLDLAAGTCDLAKLVVKKLGTNGQLVVSDINKKMLSIGRDKMYNSGLYHNIHYNIANAEQLPYSDNCFDLVTIAFGLRNVTNKELALREIYRVLRPSGMLMILECSQVKPELLGKIYDSYSFKVIPKLGELITGNREPYQYLAESIRMHPSQEKLRDMLLNAKFTKAEYTNLNFGVAAIHQGYK